MHRATFAAPDEAVLGGSRRPSRSRLMRAGAVLLGFPLALAAGLPAGTAQAAASEPPEGVRSVTLLSYNIKDGAYRARQLDTVAQEIASWSPDIVVLNEIDARRGDLPQAQYLAERLGMNWVYGANHVFGGVKWRGNAILSRYPVLKHRNTKLTWRPGTEQRGLVRAKLDLGDGMTIRVAGTHLQPKRGDIKLVQARQVSALLKKPRCATFLLGDMNAWPRSPELNALTTHFRDPLAHGRFGEGLTKPSHRPRGRIDYVLVAHRAFAQESTTLRGISDHLAVRTVFNVRPRATCTKRIPRS